VHHDFVTGTQNARGPDRRIGIVLSQNRDTALTDLTEP
jgi:hypothetical protein